MLQVHAKKQDIFTQSGPNESTATAWRMPQFAEQLSHTYDVGNRPVLDESGLNGAYDFLLSGASITAPPASETNASGTQTPDVSLFTALPEQLRLKLVPVKAPTQVLVIEKIEQPSGN